MERLTTRNIAGVAVYKNPFECDRCGDTIWRLPDYGDGSPTEKLADYEDLEEQGLLLRLPCKVGDTVYAIGFNNNRPLVYESVVLRILITEKEIVFNVKVDEFEINSQLKQSMFGKTVFLTQSEAEQKLKEMESD